MSLMLPSWSILFPLMDFDFLSFLFTVFVCLASLFVFVCFISQEPNVFIIKELNPNLTIKLMNSINAILALNTIDDFMFSRILLNENK